MKKGNCWQNNHNEGEKYIVFSIFNHLFSLLLAKSSERQETNHDECENAKTPHEHITGTYFINNANNNKNADVCSILDELCHDVNGKKDDELDEIFHVQIKDSFAVITMLHQRNTHSFILKRHSKVPETFLYRQYVENDSKVSC